MGVRRLRCFLCGLCSSCGRGPQDPPGAATTPMRGVPAEPSGGSRAAAHGPPALSGSTPSAAQEARADGGLGDEARAALDRAQREKCPEVCSHALADVDVDFRPLLTALDASNVIRLVNALVCNYSVICVSDDLGSLPMLITAAIALMHPLDWSPNVCIHVRGGGGGGGTYNCLSLPLSKVLGVAVFQPELVDAPFPFVALQLLLVYTTACVVCVCVCVYARVCGRVVACGCRYFYGGPRHLLTRLDLTDCKALVIDVDKNAVLHDPIAPECRWPARLSLRCGHDSAPSGAVWVGP